MSMNATIVGLKGTVGFLTDIPKQTRFATAKTLTQSAWAAQKFTVDKLLPEKFTIRSKSPGRPWSKFGKFRFKVKQATKEKLRAEVESIAPWIEDHERGGSRSGPKAIGGVAIPFTARPSPNAVIPRPLKAIKASRKRGAYIGPSPTGKSEALYIPHVGGDGAYRLLYLIQKSVRIKKTLGFETKAPKIAAKEFEKRFDKNFQAAMKDSAKRHFKPI